MATAALNVFRTYTAILSTTSGNTDLYIAPAGYSGIILMAQISNVSGSTAKATVSHYADGVTTELLKEFAIPAHDAASATTGKLVLQTGHSLRVSADINGVLKLTLSVLESANA